MSHGQVRALSSFPEDLVPVGVPLGSWAQILGRFTGVMVSTAEASGILGVSHPAVARLVRAGLFAHAKFSNGRTLVLRSDIEIWKRLHELYGSRVSPASREALLAFTPVMEAERSAAGKNVA